MPHARLLAACALATALLMATPGVAAAQSKRAPSAGSSGQPKLTVNVSVNRFKARGAKTVAKGVVTGKLGGVGGRTTTIRQPVTLTVKKGGSCNILTLVLDKLDLTLLGLNVHLDKVNLEVTGRPGGGVLGRLFCRLANAKISARASAIDALNSRLERHPVRPLRFSVPLNAVTSQTAGTCQVLDLVLGPLHLDLLGLVVDLNQVHLTITATRGGGVLGDLFCALASKPIPL
jgi:hypothetical protein